MLGPRTPVATGAADAGGMREASCPCGAGPGWPLERFALSDHILLGSGGPEVSRWRWGRQPGSETHCRQPASCTYMPEFSERSHMAIHMYGHKHPPQDTDAAQRYLGAAFDHSFEKFSSSRINCTHGPNKFNAIKSLLNLRHEHKCLFKCSQMIFLQH